MLDLTLGPSFKVKRWSTGFGELSFWWIQIYIGSPMHRSSLNHEMAFVLWSFHVITDLPVVLLVTLTLLQFVSLSMYNRSACSVVGDFEMAPNFHSLHYATGLPPV